MNSCLQNDAGGWRCYPSNSAALVSLADAQRYNARLLKDAERLFVSNAETQLQVVRLDLTGREPLKLSHKFFEDQWALASPSIESNTTFIAFIRQSYTWSRLLISEEYLRRLFSCLCVHPRFLDVVHLFGEKIAPVEESFAVFFDRLNMDVTKDALNPIKHIYGYEIGYNIKYVEEHGRLFPKDPFSIRETGVYQKWSPTCKKSVWIFIQPSGLLKGFLEEKLPKVIQSDAAEQLKVHGEILLMASENWRPYLNYLEEAFSKLVDLGFYSDVKEPLTEGAINVDISDVRRLRMLMDKVIRLSHILYLNTEVCMRLQNTVERVKRSWALDKSALHRFEEVESMLELFSFQHRIHKARLDSLQQRASVIAPLIRNVLDFRAAESNSRINEAMRDLTKQGLVENCLVRQLTRQAAEDTRFMKVIALITTIFLPATFVATLFGSNFFGFDTNGYGHLLVVASNIWIYVVVSVVLLCFTVVAYWWLWQKGRAKIQDEERL